MSKLEETLDLFEKIKNPEQAYIESKKLLNDRLDELLKDYDFKLVKESCGISLYTKGEEIFIKFREESSHDYADRYYWVSSKVDPNDFYKKFKKTVKTSFYDELTSIASGFVTGGLCLSLIYCTKEAEPGLGATGFIFSGLLSLLVTSYLLSSRNEKKLKESCKELYYDKEALEKAFGG